MTNNMTQQSYNIIDPHIHLFDLVKGGYHWLKKENPPFWPDKEVINANFNENDLSLTSPLTLNGFVHIEAGFDNKQPWREIAWLESHCHLPFKSVAAIDLTLTEADFKLHIAKLTAYASVVGCRHILDEQAVEILSQPTVKNNLAYLAQQNLSFDAQFSVSDGIAVDCLVTILKNTPQLKVIINHSGFPPAECDITHHNNKWHEWLSGLEKLSQFSQCAIKCSGWEMLDRVFSLAWQQYVIQKCLNAFGEKRVMLASNFPLILLSQPYQSYWQATLLSENSERSESTGGSNLYSNPMLLSALISSNAKKWYRF